MAAAGRLRSRPAVVLRERTHPGRSLERPSVSGRACRRRVARVPARDASCHRSRRARPSRLSSVPQRPEAIGAEEHRPDARNHHRALGIGLPPPPPRITSTGPSTNCRRNSARRSCRCSLALLLGRADLGAPVSRGRRRGVAGRLNGERTHQERGDIVAVAHPLPPPGRRGIEQQAIGRNRGVRERAHETFPCFRARQQLSIALGDRVGGRRLPRRRCPCTAARPSVISTVRSSSALPGYSARRACRNASASRTAATRAAPDSRSARASARHSSRSQYRPSITSRCSFDAAEPPVRACAGTTRGTSRG